MAKSKISEIGEPAFDAYFQSVYGERWKSLKSALLNPAKQVPRFNQMSGGPLAWNGVGDIPRSQSGLLSHYIMDEASIHVANALGVQPDDEVLDMCAAPGGKSLILLEALGKSGRLIANELSADRRERLKKVIQQYVPRDVRDHVFITGKDAGKFALTHARVFDRILVDAPCSGERHLLENQKYLKDWQISRSEKLAQRQYALLTAALIAGKSGARVVYSTCSISPLENDGVIRKLMQKKDGQFQVEKISPNKDCEVTEYGQIFLPDQSPCGPIYFSVLQVT